MLHSRAGLGVEGLLFHNMIEHYAFSDTQQTSEQYVPEAP